MGGEWQSLLLTGLSSTCVDTTATSQADVGISKSPSKRDSSHKRLSLLCGSTTPYHTAEQLEATFTQVESTVGCPVT